MQLSRIRTWARSRQLILLLVLLDGVAERRTAPQGSTVCPFSIKAAKASNALFQDPKRASYVPSENLDTPCALSNSLPKGWRPRVVQTLAMFSNNSASGICCLLGAAS